MKKRTTIYVDQKVIELARLKNINLSELVDHLLDTYLSIDSIENIDREIERYNAMIKVLNERRQYLIDNKNIFDNMDLLKEKAWDKLYNGFKVRRDQGINDFFDKQWITGHVDLLSVLGVSADEALNVLRGRYEKEFKKGDEGV